MLDNFRETAITWDKANRKVYEPLRVSAGDNKGRKLSVQVVNGGVIENLSGASLSLFWETKDKAHKGLDAFTAVDATKGEFEIYYTTGMLSNEGTLNANLVLVDTSGRVVSEPFPITVFKGIDDDAIQSSDSFTALTEALAQVGTINNKADRDELLALESTFEQNKVSVEQQLQQTAGELDFKKIDKNKGAITPADLSQEVKEQMTGGSVAVVGKDSVTSETVLDFSLTPENLAFIHDMGGEVAINQVKNGRASVDSNGDGLADGWLIGNEVTAYRISNGYQLWTASGTAYNSRITNTLKYNFILGHKYYISYYQVNVGYGYFGFSSPEGLLGYHSTNGRNQVVIENTLTDNTNQLFFFPRTAGLESRVGSVVVVDLTEMFGAGNEPTQTQAVDIFSKADTFFEWYFNKNNNEVKTKGKKGLLFGDSITETATMEEDGSNYQEPIATNWPTYITDLRLKSIKNYARSGATYKEQSVAGDRRKSISEQIEMAISNGEEADIIVISAGTNDSSNEIGSYNTAMTKTTLEDLDRTNLYEALRFSFWTLRNHYPNATFFVATPIQRALQEQPSQMLEAVTRMAKRYNFIIINAHDESGIIREFETSGESGRFLRDGLHPNDNGKKLLANLYMRVILNTLNY